MKQTKVFIYGKHALEEALEGAPKALTKVYFDHKLADRALVKRVEAAGIPMGPLSLGLARADMRSGTSHQGVVGQVSTRELLVPYQKFAQGLAVTPDTALVLLCGVQDPHNVGAIVRSAAGFGAAGVLLPQKGTAPVTGSVINVSSGMAFKLPLVDVENLEATVSDLKKRGFRVYGLTGRGKASLANEPFAAPALFVLGNEAEGLPRHIAALCDALLCAPMHPRTESLNVAAAGAVALYQWSTRHENALK